MWSWKGNAMRHIVLEIRDEGTHIAVLAIQMKADNRTQAYYVHTRTRHPWNGSNVTVMLLDDKRATNDLYEWGALGMGSRTMPTAHDFIEKHFDDLLDGDVVDVQYLLGETKAPKLSERFPESSDGNPFKAREVFTMADYRRESQE